MEAQKTPNSQSNLEKEKRSWGNQAGAWDMMTQMMPSSDGNWTHEACAQQITGDVHLIFSLELDMDVNDMDMQGELDHLEGDESTESKSQQAEPNE